MRYSEFYTPEESDLMVKALQCIEVLCENNCIDSNSSVDEHPLDCRWCEVYKLAHAGQSPSCRNSHKSWEETVKALHIYLSKSGL